MGATIFNHKKIPGTVKYQELNLIDIDNLGVTNRNVGNLEELAKFQMELSGVVTNGLNWTLGFGIFTLSNFCIR